MLLIDMRTAKPVREAWLLIRNVSALEGQPIIDLNDEDIKISIRVLSLIVTKRWDEK